MRKIFLDTETTGFSPAHGARIVEIAAVGEGEGDVNLAHTATAGSNDYHHYINPECPVPAEAYQVHGLGDEFLADKPLFADIAESFIDYIRGSEIIIHNAAFDRRMLNAELARLGLPRLDDVAVTITCSLRLARTRYKQENSLEALCHRYHISLHQRQFHGALLDAHLLRSVYYHLINTAPPR